MCTLYLVDNVVFSLFEVLSGHLGSHDMHDLHVVSKDGLLPEHLAEDSFDKRFSFAS